MDTIVLKEFISLAKYLNFSEAAYFLHISQPTLSRHIAQLEYEMKTPLFFRNQTTRQLSLTPAGEMLLPDAEAMVALYESATKKMEAHLSGYDKELIIGYRRLYDSEEWSQIISSFTEKYPRINLEFASNKDFTVLYSNLYNDVTDVAIVVGINEFEKKEFKKVFFAKTSLCAVMSVDHPLATKRNVSFSDLANQKIILPAVENSLSFSRDLEKMFTEHNPDFRAYKYAKNIEDAEIMVGLYNCINIIPKYYFTKSSKNLCAKEIRGTEDTINIYCYYKKEAVDDASIRQFVHHCQSYHANKKN